MDGNCDCSVFIPVALARSFSIHTACLNAGGSYHNPIMIGLVTSDEIVSRTSFNKKDLICNAMFVSAGG